MYRSDAFNYNIEANTNDNSCIDIINGCMDPAYLEYNSGANTDPGLCDVPIILWLYGYSSI